MSDITSKDDVVMDDLDLGINEEALIMEISAAQIAHEESYGYYR